MALLALEPVASTASIPPAETEAPGLPHALDAFAEVIEAIDSDASLDEILHLVAQRICLLVDCSRCGVYLKHSDADLFRGQVIEPCAPGADERIRRLICGTPADRLTQEILATQQPVLVRNAQEDPRAVRSIMQSWGVRSILGVPMIVRGDVVGMLFLDNEQTPHPFSADQERDGFIRSAIFLEDIRVISVDDDIELLLLHICFLQLNKDVADALGFLVLVDIEFNIVALAFAAKFRELCRVVGDKRTQFALTFCEIVACRV